jgi:hypothetical protein
MYFHGAIPTMELPPLRFPDYKLTIKKSGTGNGRLKIFDKIRLKYVSLTPEEWVRQHLLAFLTLDKGYPAGLIGVEKEIKVNTMSKRFDALIYNRDHSPYILIECKAPTVALDQSVFDQVSRYNTLLKVPYLLISNGLDTFFLRVNPIAETYEFLQEIPHFNPH